MQTDDRGNPSSVCCIINLADKALLNLILFSGLMLGHALVYVLASIRALISAGHVLLMHGAGGGHVVRHRTRYHHAAHVPVTAHAIHGHHRVTGFGVTHLPVSLLAGRTGVHLAVAGHVHIRGIHRARA